MQKDHFAQFGGVHFTNQASPQEINRYVRDLPPEKKESLYDVLHALQAAKLIRIENDGLWADGEGEIGGSQDC